MYDKKKRNRQEKGWQGAGQKLLPTTEREGAPSLSLRHCDSPICPVSRLSNSPLTLASFLSWIMYTMPALAPQITKLYRDARLTRAFYTI